MNRRRFGLSTTSRLSIFLVIGVFAMMALLTAVLGVGVYRSVAARAESNYNLRTSVNYVVGKIRSAGVDSEIRIDKTENGSDVLVISQPIDGQRFETRIYAFDGNLYEVFCAEDSDFDLGHGQIIVATEKFKLSQEKQELIRIEMVIDGETHVVHVAL